MHLLADVTAAILCTVMVYCISAVASRRQYEQNSSILRIIWGRIVIFFYILWT